MYPTSNLTVLVKLVKVSLPMHELIHNIVCRKVFGAVQKWHQVQGLDKQGTQGVVVCLYTLVSHEGVPSGTPARGHFFKSN
jgi:hypothetical protein